MYDIPKSAKDMLPFPLLNDTVPTPCVPDPQDPWLFTDPAAKALYQLRDQLDDLQQDICTNVMYEGRWATNELAFKAELQALLTTGALIPKGTFGFLSPHPTVYRAQQETTLAINECRFYLHPGEDVIFMPWLERISTPSSCCPVYVGHLRSAPAPQLCRETYPDICQSRRQDIAFLHHILVTFFPNGAGTHGLA